jgi:hypothetical protein
MSRKRTILLYGRTRSGKSTQLGQLAEYVYKTEGKRTRLYTADRGGYDPIRPYVDLGVIEVVEMGETDAWIFLDQAVRGRVRDEKGKWVPGNNTEIGMYAFESMTSFGDELMSSMAKKASEGVNIGGGANASFLVKEGDDSVKVSGNNMAHYGVAQSHITGKVWQSQKLPANWILWTASVSKDDDQAASGKVLGPSVCGKALTAEIPRWFNLTFRMDCTPAQNGKGEEHLLYLGNNIDTGAGNAIGLGNTRTCLDAPEIKETVIKPASITKALELIDGGYNETIKKRLNMSK